MRRGDWRLAHDLVVIEHAMRGPAGPARERIDRALGPELARAVLRSLDAPSARAA